MGVGIRGDEGQRDGEGEVTKLGESISDFGEGIEVGCYSWDVPVSRGRERWGRGGDDELRLLSRFPSELTSLVFLPRLKETDAKLTGLL